MMSTSAFSSISFLKSRDPLCAITPRLASMSSLVMPIPLSETVTVRASLSYETSILKSSLATATSGSVMDL